MTSPIGGGLNKTLDAANQHQQQYKTAKGLHRDFLRQDLHNRSTLLQNSPLLDKKISKNIQNGRIDVIQKQWEAKIKKLEQPQEVLSRNPEEIRRHRELAREKRQKEMKELLDQDQRLPALTKYQQLSPSELGSFLNSRTTMPLSWNRDGAKLTHT